MLHSLNRNAVKMKLLLLLQLCLVHRVVVGYEATWESLDSRPLPAWYPDAKIGIFIHWGVFSVPSFGSEWFWESWATKKTQDYEAFINVTENIRFAYPDYAHRFDATLYDPKFWADVFAKAGAQYVVLTSKHHEGFCMWDSRKISSTWNWNAMDVGPRRDLLGDLAEAVRKDVSPHTGKPLRFGAYHSMYEWFNPLYLQDKHNNFSSSLFVDTKTMPELYELVEKYQVEVIWSDGDWEASPEYWKSKEFLAWLATNSSVKNTVVWNDRWGKGTSCKHGSYVNCRDRYLPNATSHRYFEAAMTLDKDSWGANRRSSAMDYLTTKELLVTLVKTISRNGNLLINVGPSADGTINPIMVDRLLEMGKWLFVNGEGVYNSRSWNDCTEDDETILYTRSVGQRKGDDVSDGRADILYVFLTEWKTKVTLTCPTPTASTRVRMLGLPQQGSIEEPKVVVSAEKGPSITIQLPALTPDIIPCDHIWVLAIEGLENLQPISKRGKLAPEVEQADKTTRWRK